MNGNALCTGQFSCMSFGVIIILLFMAVFFNYIVRCLHSSPRARYPSDLPVTNGGGAPDDGGGIVPDRPPLSVNSPLYRHAIGSIPIVAYGVSNSNGKSSSGSRDSFERENCAICLAEFEERDEVRILTKCKHVYHVECIDQWLRRSLGCPVCRERVVDQEIHAKILSDYHQQHQLGAVAISNNDNNHVNDLSPPSLVVNIGNGHASVYI